MTAVEIQSDDRPSAYMEDGTIILRASSLGSCTRDLVGLLLGHEPLPTPPDVQARFDAGSKAEPHILQRLVDLGYVFDEEQKQAEGELRVLPPGKNGEPAVVVRFHPDGVADDPHFPGVRRVIEAKALAPSTFEQAQKKGTGSLFGYDWQLSVMMHAYKLPALWMAICKNPDDGDDFTGELHVEYVDTPPRSMGELVRRAKQVRDAFLDGEMPACENESQYPCPLLYLRPVKEDTREWSDVPDELADEFEQLAAEYEVLTEVVASGTAADKERKGIKARLLEIVGERDAVSGRGWSVTRTVSERPKMVKGDETYTVVTITVSKD